MELPFDLFGALLCICRDTANRKLVHTPRLKSHTLKPIYKEPHMMILTFLIAGLAGAILVHSLLTLRYAMSEEWKLRQRLNRYL